MVKDRLEGMMPRNSRSIGTSSTLSSVGSFVSKRILTPSLFKNVVGNPTTKCLEWQKADDVKVSYGSKRVPFWHYAWLLAGYKFSGKMRPIRKCKNKKCCNVDHMRLSSSKETF